MANEESGRGPAGTSLSLVALWLAACAMPDSEGATDAAPADLAEVQPMAAQPARSPQRRDSAVHWLEPEHSERWPHGSAGASDIRTMIVVEAARHRGVPPALALAVAKVGSNFAARALDATAPSARCRFRWRWPTSSTRTRTTCSRQPRTSALPSRVWRLSTSATQAIGNSRSLTIEAARCPRHTVPSRPTRPPGATCATCCAGGSSTDTIRLPQRGCARCKGCRVSPLAPAAQGSGPRPLRQQAGRRRTQMAALGAPLLADDGSNDEWRPRSARGLAPR